jgi:hypothetical protein
MSEFVRKLVDDIVAPRMEEAFNYRSATRALRALRKDARRQVSAFDAEEFDRFRLAFWYHAHLFRAYGVTSHKTVENIYYEARKAGPR